jgi:deoxyribodipyrimidine photo-lyase
MVEPLRKKPRAVLPIPISLPRLPPRIPPQALPFEIPDTFEGLLDSLLEPIHRQPLVEDPPEWPAIAKTAYPFHGGARTARERLNHLISSGAMANYKQTRNGLLGDDFCTKLSSWLALGSITARQIHAALVEFEDGTTDLGKDAPGYGSGENEGTYAIRYELIWRDYMRLCTRKFGTRLFSLGGFKKDTSYPWKAPDIDEETKTVLSRFLSGTTGMGLIDASQRELFLTGYTSNRARQNVASYLGKRLDIDWRVGAEWYETMLIDYDVSSNWGNWQYVVNVGNNPKNNPPFNQVMQSGRYDPAGDYPRTWVKELGDAHEQALSLNNASGNGDEITGSPPPQERDWRLLPSEFFQAWTMPLDKQKALGLSNVLWINDPLIKINFTVGPPQNQRGQGRGSDGSRGGNQIGGGRGYHSTGSGGRGNRGGGGGGGGNRGFYSMAGRGARGGGYGNAPSGQGFGRGGGMGMARVYRGYMTGVGGDRGRGGRGSHSRGPTPMVATPSHNERPEREEEKGVATVASVEVDDVET